MTESIAIIGMSCQIPGVGEDVEDVNAMYKMLLNQQTSIKEVPANRWDINEYYDPARKKANKMQSRKGGFLNDPRLFDAAYFKITSTEAKQIDPQHRLFLEVSVRALNNSNIRLDSLENTNTGIYCGISTHDYSHLNFKDNIHFNAYSSVGSAGSAAAGRLGYFLNLKGPSITVDTACSSSLSALYLAATALRNGQCDMAIVGGVHLGLCPESFVSASKANMLSKSGQCSSFDSKADGYARSEGCGVIIIKRLSDAIKDNNKVLAVLKSIVMNQDGSGKRMMTPSAKAQAALHQAALQEASLEPSEINYIESHGTGTIVGDSTEFEAIQQIHQGKHLSDTPLIIGALKPNLGHTLSVSGIISLIKTVKAFNEEMIPSNLHFDKPAPSIAAETIPALFPTKNIKFKRQANKKRYAQVSNFGFTGTNVMAILEEPPVSEASFSNHKDGQTCCFLASAQSEKSLLTLMDRYLEMLKTSSDNLSDICYTLINHRDHYKYRCAINAASIEELITKIKSKDYQIKEVSINKDIMPVDDFEHIDEHYLLGCNIKLQNLNNRFSAVELPSYSFDRKPYWHENPSKTQTIAQENPLTLDIPADWCFELTWQQQPLEQVQPFTQDGPWVIIGDEQLVSRLKKHGLQVLHEKDWDISNKTAGIIFCADFDSNSLSNKEPALDLEHQKNTLKKLLNLVKNLNQHQVNSSLIVLTSNAIAELSEDKINLNTSHLPGFCKTLTLELPQFRPILIDIDEPDNPMMPAMVIREICNSQETNVEHIIAYRSGKRFIHRMVPGAVPRSVTSSISGNGRYLISGGCGGLGLVSAEALLASGATEVILLSRTTDKPESISQIEHLQSMYPYSKLRAVSLDITNKEQLNTFFLENNKDGQLKGIIHAAGASYNARLIDHEERDIDHLFSAKVEGGWYLHELSQQHCDLDFFIAYSSISSAFGSNKESCYSGTNSFLDALMAERRSQGLPGTSIQWGPWAEVGMAKGRSWGDDLRKALIYNQQGKNFIQAVLQHSPSQTVFISPQFLHFMLDFVPKPMPFFYKSLQDVLTASSQKTDIQNSTWLERYKTIDENTRRAECINMLTRISKEILDLQSNEMIDADEGFFDLGFDSLMMAELSTRLKEMLNPVVNITASTAFEYPTPNALASYIESELSSLVPALENKINREEPIQNDDIAIIGMSCQLPNAADLNAFKELLEKGLSGIKEIPQERWGQRPPLQQDQKYKPDFKKLGLLDNVFDFDGSFFGISPREAIYMDPQQRILLENCHKALEHANYSPKSLRGSQTGVYIGASASQEYYTLMSKAGLIDNEQGLFIVTGSIFSMLSGRIAYKFDFKGPAITIDTACSSSLVAVHNACQDLRNKEINYALACGMNVLFRYENIDRLFNARVISSDHQCKTFDKDADGYVRAEGCGVLVLKRLSDAIRDKDNVLAVIKASAINSDGMSAGLTAPNAKSQEEVMKKALEKSSLSSSDISYIEAHGSGTPLGDPIEVHSINKVYGQQRGNHNPLYLGALKTNIGHSECASGIAGIIKTVISLNEHKIYKNLNFRELNPSIQLNETRLPLENISWETTSKRHCAAVNSFGLSGTNAHVILQEFPENSAQRSDITSEQNLLVLSAKSEYSLEQLKSSYINYLETTQYSFKDICFTAANCRDHYSHRLLVAAGNKQEAAEFLKNGKYAKNHVDSAKLELERQNISVANAYLNRTDIDWTSFYQQKGGDFIKVKLPLYVFDKREYKPDFNVMNKSTTGLVDFDSSMTGQSSAIKDKIDWESYLKNSPVESDFQNSERNQVTSSSSNFIELLKQYKKSEQITLLSEAMTFIVADILMLEDVSQVDISDDLFSIGMDSLTSLELRNKVSDKLNCPDLSLPIEFFITDPTISKISKNIADELERFFLSSKDWNKPKSKLNETALCDGQYIFWMNQKIKSSFNCGMQIQLKGHLNVERLSLAISHTIKQHDVFWMTVNENTPIQHRNKPGEFKLDYIDISEIENKEILNTVFNHQMEKLFQRLTPPLVNIDLYKLDDNLHELQLIIPHIILDESSYRILIQQFNENYQALMTEQPMKSLRFEYDYFDYVKKSNALYEENIKEKIDFWNMYNKGVKQVFFGQQHHLADASVQPKELYHHFIDNTVVEKFKTWHQDRNINISTGLIGLCQLVFFKLSQQNKIPISILHSGREGSHYQSLIGVFTQYKCINVTVEEQMTYLDFLKSIDNQFLYTAPYQKCLLNIKQDGLEDTKLSKIEYLIFTYYRLFHKSKFRKTKLHPKAIKYQFKHLSKFLYRKLVLMTRFKLNRLLNLNLPLMEPARLRILINITSSLFLKEAESTDFYGLKGSFPNQFGTVSKHIGNKTLWLYFSSDQFGQYRISINGPITKNCKNLLAQGVSQLMKEIVENDVQSVDELLSLLDKKETVKRRTPVTADSQE